MNIKKEQNIQAIAQRFEGILSGFIDSTKDRERSFNETYFRQIISKAAHNYARNYLEDQAYIQLFGSQKPLLLSSIYIPQRFQASASIRNFESVEELEAAFSRDLQRSNRSKGNNLLGLNIANEEAYLTILGQPATGKTTFLKYIGLESLRYAKGRYQHNVVPVFIQMWKFCSSSDSLLQAIAEEFEKCGFPEVQELVIWLLEQGKLLILIDGLNEATLSQKHLSKHLRTFVNTYPQNRYIVSSRLASYQNSLGQFLELELQCWHDLHVQEYIHKWFAIAYEPKINRSIDEVNNQLIKSEQNLASAEAQRCWQILQTNTVAREIANSPLSLSLLCLLCNHRYSFPSNVSSLYKKAINLVLEEQVLQHQTISNENNNNLSTDVLDILLTEIAYKGFELCQPCLSFDEVTEWIQTSLNNCAGNLQKLEVDFILKVLQQLGICKIVSSSTYSSFIFSHITFQEYFVARYIYNHNKVRQLVPNHLSDRRWQQVFLLLAGMMVGHTEELLLCIESQAADYINTAKLRDILDWLEQVTLNSKGKLKNVAKRIATLFLARPRFLNELAPALVLTRMLGLARDLYENFDSSLDFDKVFASDLSMSLSHALDFDSATELGLTIQLCSSLEQALAKIEFDQKYINFTALHDRLESLNMEVPSYEQPFEVCEAFRNKISCTWLQTLYLPADLNQISQQEVEALKNYLYANLLMVRCKKMAIIVSQKTWNEIESRILKTRRL